MQTSQRGSVLLTIIGGIVILALLGMVAVSLMTGSVMTGLDAKETVQASYLAESGKEIVRVQTSKADTGARLMTLVDDTLDGKTFSITGGNVSLKLFPSCVSHFRHRDVAEGRFRLVSRSAIRDARTFADCQIGYSQQS